MKVFSRVPAPFVAVLACVVLAGCPAPDDPDVAVAPDREPMSSLVDVQWLTKHLDDPDLVVLDCSVLIEQTADGDMRSVSGEAAFHEGHIPTARFADLKGALSDGDSDIQFAVPTPEQFAQAMGELGVGDASRVVLYDRTNSAWAARVWWMLRWVGFDNAALLDGGLDAWTKAGQTLSTDTGEYLTQHLSVALRPELIADRSDVRAAVTDESVELVDALSALHYRGEFSMYERSGHIKSASNVPMTSLFDETGSYRDREDLAALFGEAHDRRVINYCGGGIAASANAFAMIRAGYTDVAVYTASLQEWAADPANPMAVSTHQE